MALIIKLALLAAIHVALFICYPDTGPNGNLYLGISLVLWSIVVVFLGGSVAFLKLAAKAVVFIFYIAVFLAMGSVTALTMPQADRTSVFTKLKKRDFPTIDTMRRGLERFGVKLEKRARKEIKAADSRLEDAVENAVDKLKGN